ncbi:MAG: protease complex subunit PrcB family protein [Patescibacteria group bacterium]
MRDTLIIIGLALVTVVIGAFLYFRGNTSNASPSIAPTSQPSAVAVPFTPLARGNTSTVTKRVNYLITSADGLDKLWKMLDATSTPPTVDFNKNAVIAVFAGQQPTTGYAIEVSKIADLSSRLVSITLAKPDGACITGQSLTTPYEIVTVPTTSLPLAHEDISTTVSCP